MFRFIPNSKGENNEIFFRNFTKKNKNKKDQKKKRTTLKLIEFWAFLCLILPNFSSVLDIRSFR